MRRIDIVLIGAIAFLVGGGLFWGFKFAGFDDLDAGRWSQLVFILGLIGWVMSYLFRVNGRQMTYHQQLEDYETAVLQQRLEELSPDELAQLQAEIEAESQEASS
ncbi:MAG: DUF3007 family protein [Cyanobacteria bacterium P01_F01_bin.42]